MCTKVNWLFSQFSHMQCMFDSQEVNLNFHKCDELDCLIQGIHFIDRTSPQSECYYWHDSSKQIESCEKRAFDFTDPYPYLCVNIGSGVSMLGVYGPRNYERLSGTRYVHLPHCACLQDL